MSADPTAGRRSALRCGACWTRSCPRRQAGGRSSIPQHRLIRLSADPIKVTVMHVRTLAALVLPVAVLISACSGASPTAPEPASSPGGSAIATTRTSEGGQVTVVVDWAGPDDGAVFDVALDTHSVDLDALDLSDAVLRNDRGETLAAQPWTAPKGGHHREGALAFEGDAQAFFAGAVWIELVVSGVGDLPERSLRWEVGS